jgi:hypothetical protein
MRGLGIHTKRLALEIDDAKAKVTMAEQKHKDAVDYQRWREDQLNSAMGSKSRTRPSCLRAGFSP